MKTQETINTADLSEDQKLVLEIAQTYVHPNGGTDWKRAFTEHPDWRERLSYSKADDKAQKAYNVQNELRARGLLPRKTTVAGRPQGRPPGTGKIPGSKGRLRSDNPNRTGPVLGPRSKLLLGLMLDHADGAGYLTPRELDELKPGWRAPFGDMHDRAIASTFSRLRKSKAFKRARTANRDARREGLTETQIHAVSLRQEAQRRIPMPPPAATNGKAEPPEVVDQQEFDKRVRQAATRMFDELFEQIHFCSRCGDDIGSTLREKFVKLRHAV